MSQVNQCSGGCFNLWNHRATPRRQAFAWSVVVLATIAIAAGVLSILASSGINVYGLNALGTLTIYGGASLTLVSFTLFVVGLAWLITKVCCHPTQLPLPESQIPQEEGVVPLFTPLNLVHPGESHIEKLPAPLIGEIFSHLGLQELGRCCSVSKRMKGELDNSLNQGLRLKILRKERAFDAQKWAMYFGDVGVEPPLPSNIMEILNSPCPFFANKKVGATHMLVLVPATVGGEALTLNKLQQLINNPLNNNCRPTNYNVYDDKVKDLLGDKGVNQSCWVLMTKDAIPDSRGKTYNEQKGLVEQYGNLGYTLPGALEAAVCIFMEHVFSRKRRFGVEPLVYTRCSDVVGEHPVIVGGFDAQGLNVQISADSGVLGFSALRKL